MTDFVHLHTHSDYSLLDGAASIDSLVAKAVEYGMEDLALTDHGGMFGIIRFYKTCRERGIHPIIGSEFYLAPGSRFDKAGGEKRQRSYHLILLASDMTGYRNLLKLSSLSYTEGFYYKPRIDWELLEGNAEGLVCLSACLSGEVPSLLLEGRDGEAKEKALRYRELFGRENFYLELQDHGIDQQKRLNRWLLELSVSSGIPLVASNDIHYPSKEDARAQDILICIGTNRKVSDGQRLKFAHPEFYFKSGQEMAALFSETPSALKNSRRIAEMCRFELPLSGPVFPRYAVPQGYSAESYLTELAEKGLSERYGTVTEEMRERLKYELSVICKTGFADYCLIVWDFIRFAREKGIAVGPGRGSGAGSLVAFSLRITDIDPIAFGLLFERFLNPERVSIPDFDIDFCFERRGEVIDYVTEKYSSDRVGQVITFGTLKAKAVIRDVARVLDFPYPEADKIAKMVPEGPKITLAKALEADPELAKIKDESERHAELFDVSLRLEGLARHASTHAAGIVIGREDLCHYVPLYRDSKTGAVSTQYTWDHLEDCGLAKMDFLGLKTLTIIEKTVWTIRARGVDFDIDTIALDDPATFTLFGRGKSTCVFQFESTAFQSILSRSKPESIDDLSALVALYRPGPMENIDKYIDAKTGRLAITYPLAELEPILKETYGVIIYQEQVLKIAQKVAGYTLGQADILRSAMGKKKPAVMARQKKKFKEGAIKNGYSEKVATDLFDLLIPFAGYGFNKSHAAAYALLAYKTAFLKANYPCEFMAANLTNEINNTDKLSLYMSEARQMGIEILPPDINLSEKEFTVANGTIVYGLCGVKNVGSAAVENIISERKSNGSFKSVANLLERVDFRLVNRKVSEALIMTGVLDSLGENRATLFHNLDRLLDAASTVRESRATGQISLFGDSPMGWLGDIRLEQQPEWPRMELLKLEKQNLGFFFSGHPLSDYQSAIEAHTSLDLSSAPEAAQEGTYTVVGMIKEHKEILTRNAKRMAFGTLEDLRGSIELIVFPDILERYRDLFKVDTVLAVKGKLDRRRGTAQFIVNEAMKPEQIPEKQARAVHIRISDKLNNEDSLYRLREIIFERKGVCALYIHLNGSTEGKERVVRASSALDVSSRPADLEKMRQHPLVESVWKE
jgi:DNA polymerase-3 subunit alpha